WLSVPAAAPAPKQFAHAAEHVNAYIKTSDKIATTNRARISPHALTTETIAPRRPHRKRAPLITVKAGNPISSARASADIEVPHDQPRIGGHVRGDGVKAPQVHPRVSSAHREE